MARCGLWGLEASRRASGGLLLWCLTEGGVASADSLPLGTCTASPDCPDTQLCVEGRCTPICVADTECAPAEVCAHGYCQLLDADCAGDSGCVRPDALGVFIAGVWYLDSNGNHAWDEVPTDRNVSFGQVGQLPVVGHWVAGEPTRLGVWTPAVDSTPAVWALDANGDGALVAPPDRLLSFDPVVVGGVPVAGDWNGDRAWDVAVDELASFGYLQTLPVVGQW